ncbi:peroxisome proliferator-activated receptor gamma coactivator 1-beta-like isoform X3 [Lagopus muta]|uniref:peroxisome proliferator-activated receptor gamma coactivator 1-beta-like isoform X3 n=1 Tax=Lagopus muta TaxID=64668 RepID=UPI0020A1A0E9|nr:peroxisome proliferator-activated receptor gamma coactivator 1-beta-like isoform X3 [Lagopus muta]
MWGRRNRARGGSPQNRGGENRELREEEEEEEEEEDPGGAAAVWGAPTAQRQLRELQERMERLQEDFAASQRLNRVLEERLQGLAQTVALQRVALSQRLAEALQQLVGQEAAMGVQISPWRPTPRDGDGDNDEGPLPPPPAFRDPPAPQ